MPKIDSDVKDMTPAQLRAEVMKYRHAARKIVKTVDNARCWVNDWKLAQLLPEKPLVPAITLPDEEFLCNCKNYLKRQRRQKPPKSGRL